MSTPEGKVKEMVKRALACLPKVYHHSAVINGMGKPALDFFCCIGGEFVAIETKARGKKPTPRQLVTMAEIQQAGGKVFVIDSIEGVDDMMRSFGMARCGQVRWGMVGCG